MRPSLKIFSAVLINFSFFAHDALAALGPIDFNAPKFAPLEILSRTTTAKDAAGAPALDDSGRPINAGWESYSGTSEISATGQGYGGTGQALKLKKNTTEEAWLRKEVSWDRAETTAFIDFKIRPASDPAGSLANFFANGSQLAFQMDEQNATLGRIWAYHGADGNAGAVLPEQWLLSPGTFSVPAGATQATNWLRITLRHDYTRNLWDLFIDGKLAAVNLGFDGRGPNLQTLEFYGSRAGDTLVDDLSADPANMLFPDADKDGLPDAWEIANGSNPNLYDRDTVVGGQSYADLYMASLWSGVKVNGATGSIQATTQTVKPLTVLAAHQPVAAMKGSMSVGGDGSAAYSMPIDLPKGTAGMEPKLSLNYSSAGGNGLLGVGWALSGLQRISRGPASAAKDGNYDPVDFDVYDRFFMDGERLVCISGTNGQPGSEYRTEADSFARIKLLAGNYWTVETKAGLIVTLGATADSQETNPNGTLVWNVNRVSDSLQNFYEVAYTRDSASGQPFNQINNRVAAIHYTGHGSTLSPYCHVTFNYGERPDVGRSYGPQGGQKLTKRLQSIDVSTDKAGGGTYLNASYNLYYNPSGQTGRSMLTAIDKTVAGQTVPATSFHYDGLAANEPLWEDVSTRPGYALSATYGTNLDATGQLNSMASIEGGTAIRLTGDVSRSFVLPLGGVTLYADSKLRFTFKSDHLDAGGAFIGFDTDAVYQASPKRLYRVGGSGTVPVTFNTAGTYPDGSYPLGSEKTFEIAVGSIATGLHPYLVLMCSDESAADGFDNATFSDLRLYRSGSQTAADVQPLNLGSTWELPRFSDSLARDQGLRFMDLNSDGLADLVDWRATSYTGTGTSFAPVTVGEVYRNTGKGFVADASLRPPTALPISCRELDLEAFHFNRKHQLFAQPLDINGDGRLDLVAAVNLNYATNGSSSAIQNQYTFYTLTPTGWQEMAGWRLPFKIQNLASAAPYGGGSRTHHFEWVDINGDGYGDLAVYLTTQGAMYPLDGSTTPIASGNPADGKPASVVFLNKGKNGPGWEPASAALGLPLPLQLAFPTEEDKGRRFVDFTGDGRPEIAEAVSLGTSEIRNHYSLVAAADGTPTGWDWAPGQPDPTGPWELPTSATQEYNAAFVNASLSPFGTQLMDFNGDGLRDIIRSQQVSGVTKSGVYLNRGPLQGYWAAELRPTGGLLQEDTYDLPYPLHINISGAVSVSGHEFIDLNGDGLVDFFISQNNTGTVQWNAAVLNTGNGWKERSDWGIPGDLRICNNNSDSQTGKRRARLEDLNGDGFPDLITGLVDEIPKVWLNRCRPEVMVSVTDGFGANLQVEYRRMNDPEPLDHSDKPVYTPYSGALPVGDMAVITSNLMVARLKEYDGLGGWKCTRRHYGDLRTDRLHESSLGFAWMEVHDEHFLANGSYATYGYTRTESVHAYPFGSSPAATTSFVYVPAVSSGVPMSHQPTVTPGYKCVSEELSTYADLTPTGPIRRPVQIGSTSYKYDLAAVSGLKGNLLSRTVTNQNAVDFDDYGFVKKSTITALDGSATVTESTYQPVNAVSGPWYLGRLLGTTVTKSAPGKTTQVRKTGFTYDGTSGLLATEVVQPGNAAALTTTYGWDGFGNTISTTLSCAEPGSINRITSSGYDLRGRFIVSATSSLGTSTANYDQDKALLISSSDINGLASNFTYDIYGTLIATSLPDGTAKAEITRYATNSSLPPQVRSALGTFVGVSWAKSVQASGTPWATVYYDALGREVLQEQLVLTQNDDLGNVVYRDQYTITRYDAKGRKWLTSNPFLKGDPIYWSETVYDALDRPVGTNHPDGTSEGVALIETITSASSPLVHSTVRNRRNYMLERWEDQHDRLVQSRDASGQTTTFTHDVGGALLTASIGGQLQLQNSYDPDFGRKLSIWDISAGSSTTTYTGFGEPKTATTSAGTTTSSYDGSGRLENLTRPGTEGRFRYQYIASSSAYNKGKLSKITAVDGSGNPLAGTALAEESVYYDNYGRTIATVTNRFGQTTSSTTAYNALGLPVRETDDGGAIVMHQYDSQFGAMKLRSGLLKPGASTTSTNFTQDFTLLSSVRSTVFENVTLSLQGSTPAIRTTEQLAHQIQRVIWTDARNGRLLKIKSDGLLAKTLQDLEYQWDANGNLLARKDTLAGKTEVFTYDALDRLTSSKIGTSATVTYGYDAGGRGNLTNKGGESRSYDPTSPFRVVSATIKGAGRSYLYDASGRVSQDGKRVYGWSSTGQLRTVTQTSTPALEALAQTGKYVPEIPGIAAAAIYQPSQATATFEFGSSGDRARQTLERTFVDNSKARLVTTYLGAYEREDHTSQAAGTLNSIGTRVLHRHHVGDDLYTRDDTNADGTPDIYRLAVVLTDHIGSTDVVVRANWSAGAWSVSTGQPNSERESFDAWGERRSGDTWDAVRTADTSPQRTSAMDENCGFTGHEMLDDFGLVHMGGRIYDPELGRFLSPDPYIQVPEYSQNFNRYSYVLNNPLSYTDPSGHFIEAIEHYFHVKAFLSAREGVRNYLATHPALAQAVTIVVGVVLFFVIGPGSFGVVGSSSVWGTATTASVVASAAATGAATSSFGTAAAGGDAGDILRSGVVGGVTAAISSGVLHPLGEAAGAAASSAGRAGLTALHIAGHGVLGGASNAALGGRFQDGFLSGAAGAAAGHFGPLEGLMADAGDADIGKTVVRTLASGIIGGTASAIGGGKFANGAWTAAFQHLLNDELPSSMLETGEIENLPPIIVEAKKERGFWSGFGSGVLDAVVGIGVGIAVTALAFAIAPVVGVAVVVVGAAVGGFQLGLAINEAVTGEDWKTGEPLSSYDRGNATGQAVAGIASLGLYKGTVKPLRARGSGDLNGVSFSLGGGYGAKPRVDLHPLKGSNIPDVLQGRTILHYHRRAPGGIGRHRPFEGRNGKPFWERF